MQIQDSKTMFQHIENGGSLTLNMRGQLATESAVGRFFQKIGDAIASLTASGRAAIETRNAVLHLAMANMLRQDPVINPTQGQIPYPATPTERNALAMYLGVAQALRNFPPEARAAARNLALGLLRNQGLPEKGNPAEARGKALEVMNRILTDKVTLNTLRRCDYARTREQLDPMLREIEADMRATFMAQKDNPKEFNKERMHASYFKDVNRNIVHTINGRPPDRSDIEGEFIRLIPDEKLRAFLSMMPTQAGLPGSLELQLHGGGTTMDNTDLSDYTDMVVKGFQFGRAHPRSDIEVRDGVARIKLGMDFMIQPELEGVADALGIAVDSASAERYRPDQDHPPYIGGGRYTIEMVVDLGQDMTGKDIPEFRLENANRVPVAVPPPVLISPPPAGQAASAA
jgi:hypothetical protein